MKYILVITAFLVLPQYGFCKDWNIKNEYGYKFVISGNFLVQGRNFSETDPEKKKIDRLYIKNDEAKIFSIPLTMLSKEDINEVKILDRKKNRNIKVKVKLLHELSQNAIQADVEISKQIEAYHSSILPEELVISNKKMLHEFANNVLTNISDTRKKIVYIESGKLLHLYVFDFARTGKYGHTLKPVDYELSLNNIQIYQQVLNSEWGNQRIYVQGKQLMTYRELWNKMPINYK